MTPVFVAAMIALVASDPLTTRIEESAAAAQGLQGRFDGAWTLRDSGGVVLLVLQMSDAPGSADAIPGAWRDPAGELGPAEFEVETPERLRVMAEGSAALVLDRVHGRSGAWRGRLAGHGVVTLTRGLATPRPPV